MNKIERRHTRPRSSKIVCHGGLVYLSGQTAFGGASATAAAGIARQTEETLSRIDALLAEVGTDRTRILSATIYLRDINDFTTMNQVWESWSEVGTAPARTTVEAHLASPDLLIEVTLVAALR